MNSNGNSPARGLKTVLSLKRHSRDDGASINSGSKSPRRNSNDSSVGKLKTYITNIGTDDGYMSDGKRSAKSLLSGFGKLKDKARRRSQVIDSQEDLRGRDTEPKRPVLNKPAKETSETQEDDNASFTSESEADGPITKPPLINHLSHTGYLTSSSPKIQATMVPDELQRPRNRGASPGKRSSLLAMAVDGSQNHRASTRNKDVPIPALVIQTNDTLDGQNLVPPPPSQENSSANETIIARRRSRGSETANLPVLQLDSGETNKTQNDIPSIITVPDTPPESLTSKVAAIPARAATVKEDITYRPLAGRNFAPHRRVRSDVPPTSKLSQSMAPPLTPLEEAKTPSGSRNTSGTGLGAGAMSTGFFSSVFSVAQSAANTLTNTLQSTTKAKTPTSGKTAMEQTDGAEEDDVAQQDTLSTARPTRPLAIETIGSGDLSLDHLGIMTEQPKTNTSPASSIMQAKEDANRSRSSTIIRHEPATAGAGDTSRSVSAALSNTDTVQPADTPMAEDAQPAKMPPAVANEIAPSEQRTPTNASMIDDNSNLTRTGSIRSKLGRQAKRHRNSSGTGASFAASTNTNRFSGFIKANTKRNKDFHALFRNVPDDDDLIEDYSCALQRDIILAGRIYISEGHICFSSNILGWVTSVVISFDEIVSVEKESTAMLFANAIAIQMLHARHTFRSLLSRDATYDLIINIWRQNHPGLESSENGLRLITGTGSKTQRIMNGSGHGSDSVHSHELSESESEDSRSAMDSTEASIMGDETTSRKASQVVNNGTGQHTGNGTAAASDKLVNSIASLGDYPGPSSHTPTECNDSHLDKILKDEVVAAPLGKVYSLVFGPASNTFMSRFLQDEIKVTDLHMEDANKSLTELKQTRSFTYIKPLNNAIGPRTTKCVVTERLDSLDLEKAVVVSVTTQTPDVPSGNLFSTKTKYCLMWGPGNSTRIILTYTIEWTGKSWLKGAIERGATDGQTAYANDLVRVLKAGLSPRRSGGSGTKGRKLRKRKSDHDSQEVDDKGENWGLFQPLHNTITGIIRWLKPLFATSTIIGMLVLLLTVSWFGVPGSRYAQSAFFPNTKIPLPSHSAAWEEIWSNEEAALWEWLEDRAGLADGLAFPSRPVQTPKRNANKKDINKNDINWAIKLTEQRLASMKQKLGNTSSKQKTKQKASDPPGDTVEYTDEEAMEMEDLLSGIVGTH